MTVLAVLALLSLVAMAVAYHTQRIMFEDALEAERDSFDAEIVRSKEKVSKLEEIVSTLRREPIRLHLQPVSHNFIMTDIELESLHGGIDTAVERAMRSIRAYCETNMLVAMTDPEVTEESGYNTWPGTRFYRLTVGAIPRFAVPNNIVELGGYRALPIVEDGPETLEVIRSLTRNLGKV